METSEEGLVRFIKDFFVFDIDLDIKCGKQNEYTKKILDDAKYILKKDHFADLKVDRVLPLNCSHFKAIKNDLQFKDVIILFFNSKKHKGLRKQLEKVREYVLKNIPAV